MKKGTEKSLGALLGRHAPASRRHRCRRGLPLPLFLPLHPPRKLGPEGLQRAHALFLEQIEEPVLACRVMVPEGAVATAVAAAAAASVPPPPPAA